MTEAQNLVAQLRRAGWSQRQIAEAVSRSPSAISLAGRGKKPMTPIVPSLRRLVGRVAPGRGEPVPSVAAPRRTRRSGELAGVRGQRRRGRAAEPALGGVRISVGPIPGAGIATAGEIARPDGTTVGWHLGGWSDAGGTYHDTSAVARLTGMAPEAPPSPGAIRNATLYVEGVGYRVYSGPFTDDFDLEAAAAELADLYLGE